MKYREVIGSVVEYVVMLFIKSMKQVKLGTIGERSFKLLFQSDFAPGSCNRLPISLALTVGCPLIFTDDNMISNQTHFDQL